MWLRTEKSLRNVAQTNIMTQTNILTQKCDFDKYYDLEPRHRPKR